MRILHIASGNFFSTYGGGQVYVKNVADAMIDMGIDACVVSTVGTTSECSAKPYRGRVLYEIPERMPDDDFASLVREIAPTVIHAHSRKAQACRVGRRLGIPVVVTSHHGGILCPAGARMNCSDEICHSALSHQRCLPCVLRAVPAGRWLWYPTMRMLPQKAYLKLGRWLSGKRFMPFITPVGCSAQYIAAKMEEWSEIAEGCTLMVAPCREVAQAMTQNGLQGDKVRLVPHGIPLPAVRPAYPVVERGKVKFYYVGRICYVKGIHVLLDAFHSVDMPNIELHLIGGAGNKHESRYMVGLQKRYRDDSRIVWHGKIPPEEVFEATKGYHVAVSTPIYLEIFGLNIAEALALGKPVLASRCGGAETQIRNGENGWLVDANSAMALAGKIRDIAGSPEGLAAMSARCNAIPIQQHIEALMSVYDEAVKLSDV